MCLQSEPSCEVRRPCITCLPGSPWFGMPGQPAVGLKFWLSINKGSKGQFSSQQAGLWALGCRGELLSMDLLRGRSFICVPLVSEKKSSTVLSHCSPPASAGEPEGVAQSPLPRSPPPVLLSSLEGNVGRQSTHRCLLPPHGCHPHSPWLLHGAFLHKSHPEEQFSS